jgi:hypothetical protein
MAFNSGLAQAHDKILIIYNDGGMSAETKHVRCGIWLGRGTTGGTDKL